MPAADSTYLNLLGAIGDSGLSVAAEYLFVDPVGDLAVLCAPDNQALCDEWEAYEEFAEARTKLTIGRPTIELKEAWLFSARIGGSHAAQDWDRSVVGRLVIEDVPASAIASGTSGSPVVLTDGSAVGAVSIGERLNPVLVHHLPGWLLADLGLI